MLYPRPHQERAIFQDFFKGLKQGLSHGGIHDTKIPKRHFSVLEHRLAEEFVRHSNLFLSGYDHLESYPLR